MILRCKIPILKRFHPEYPQIDKSVLLESYFQYINIVCLYNLYQHSDYSGKVGFVVLIPTSIHY